MLKIANQNQMLFLSQADINICICNIYIEENHQSFKLNNTYVKLFYTANNINTFIKAKLKNKIIRQKKTMIE